MHGGSPGWRLRSSPLSPPSAAGARFQVSFSRPYLSRARLASFPARTHGSGRPIRSFGGSWEGGRFAGLRSRGCPGGGPYPPAAQRAAIPAGGHGSAPATPPRESPLRARESDAEGRRPRRSPPPWPRVVRGAFCVRARSPCSAFFFRGGVPRPDPTTWRGAGRTPRPWAPPALGTAADLLPG